MEGILLSNKGITSAEDWNQVYTHLHECGLVLTFENDRIHIHDGEGYLICVLFKEGLATLVTWLTQALDQILPNPTLQNDYVPRWSIEHEKRRCRNLLKIGESGGQCGI